MGDFYRIPSDKRGLNYDSAFFEGKLPLAREFNSNNTRLLTVDEVKEKLLSLEYIKTELLNTKNN